MGQAAGVVHSIQHEELPDPAPGPTEEDPDVRSGILRVPEEALHVYRFLDGVRPKSRRLDAVD